MPIEVKNLQRIPEGSHKGIITQAAIVSKVFKPHVGPEQTLEVVIQPQQPESGAYNALTVNYGVSMNPLSAIGVLADRLGVAPDFEAVSVWDEASLEGIEVTFDIQYKGQFPNVVKDSIRKA